MASPATAASHWVEKEVSHWLQKNGEGTLLIVLTEGAIAWNDERGCFGAGTTALPPAALTGITNTKSLGC